MAGGCNCSMQLYKFHTLPNSSQRWHDWELLVTNHIQYLSVTVTQHPLGDACYCVSWLEVLPTPVSAFIVLIQQTTDGVPESHTAFWDRLDLSSWALPPADKPGVFGVAVLNEVRLLPCSTIFNYVLQRNSIMHLFWTCILLSLIFYKAQ